jgi:hypothetical protein
MERPRGELEAAGSVTKQLAEWRATTDRSRHPNPRTLSSALEAIQRTVSSRSPGAAPMRLSEEDTDNLAALWAAAAKLDKIEVAAKAAEVLVGVITAAEFAQSPELLPPRSAAHGAADVGLFAGAAGQQRTSLPPLPGISSGDHKPGTGKPADSGGAAARGSGVSVSVSGGGGGGGVGGGIGWGELLLRDVLRVLLLQCELDSQRKHFLALVYHLYDRVPAHRAAFRGQLGEALALLATALREHFATNRLGNAVPQMNVLAVVMAMARGVDGLLGVLARIIRGFERPAGNSSGGSGGGGGGGGGGGSGGSSSTGSGVGSSSLSSSSTSSRLSLRDESLLHVLLPLHGVNAMVNDVTPAFSVYHGRLTEVLVELYLSSGKDAEVLHRCLGHMLDTWPDQRLVNSSKEVLLLQEISVLMGAQACVRACVRA